MSPSVMQINLSALTAKAQAVATSYVLERFMEKGKSTITCQEMTLEKESKKMLSKLSIMTVFIHGGGYK
jgi:hypothetical protein